MESTATKTNNGEDTTRIMQDAIKEVQAECGEEARNLALLNLVDGLDTMRVRLESLALISLALLESPHESMSAFSTIAELAEGYAEDAAHMSTKAKALRRTESKEG